MTEEQKRDIKKLFADLREQVGLAEDDAGDLSELAIEIEGIRQITLRSETRSAAERVSRYFDEIGGIIDELENCVEALE